MIRLKITKVNNSTIRLQAIAEYVHHGVGTFLQELAPEEIECDSFCKEALLAASLQHGVCGLEIWEQNRIAWGTIALEVKIPLVEISKEEGANTWLKLIEPIIKENNTDYKYPVYEEPGEEEKQKNDK